ncbi:hypothetical protein LIER_18529 [Lithospermum erythrorhizon]|uniref:Uncharacterized protein n=1 Tax=Lithospermum erythrorhizon TaxID=34254 RepID=A0AAV3QIS0_LITER
MPHKVPYKSIISRKDVLAQVSKRKGTSSPEASTAPKKSKRIQKEPAPEAIPSAPEAVIEAFGPPSPTAQDPITIVILDRVSPSLDVEGILTCASPDELQDTFSHFQLRATECAYDLSLKWKESEDSMAKLAGEKSSLEERLNEALARADDVENKYQDLLAVRDGLHQSKTDLTNRYEADIEKRLEELSLRPSPLYSSQLLLADIEKRLEELSLRPSSGAIVKTFKKSDTYRDLLIDNTISIMKEFSYEVYLEYPGIHSIFPEEDTESTDSMDNDALVEDAPVA